MLLPRALELGPLPLADLETRREAVPLPPIPPLIPRQYLNLSAIHRSIGVAVDLYLLDRMFPQLGDLEVCVPLSTTFLAVAMVPPLGIGMLYPI